MMGGGGEEEEVYHNCANFVCKEVTKTLSFPNFPNSDWRKVEGGRGGGEKLGK